MMVNGRVFIRSNGFMKHAAVLDGRSQAPRPSGKNGLARMDMLFKPTPDAIRAVSGAVLAIATTVPRSWQTWDEAESALCQAMLDVTGRMTRNGRHHLRCRVFCSDGRTTVTLLDPDQRPDSALGSGPSKGSLVYSDSACSIWLVDAL